MDKPLPTLMKPIEEPEPIPGDDRLLSLAETAQHLGMTYRSLMQCRVEGRVLLEEVRYSPKGPPKYRWRDVLAVIEGETYALSPGLADEKEKAEIRDRMRAKRAATRDKERGIKKAVAGE